MEVFSNNPVDSLNGAINNSTTSIVVHDATNFGTTGTFRIIIENEIMKVTGVSSNTLTVVRGQEGTTAVSHADGMSVWGIITKEALKQYRADTNQIGAMASLPSVGNPGVTYHSTDDLLMAVDDGTNWNYFGPVYKCTLPDATQFSTWINQGSATFAQTGGAIIFKAPCSNGTTDNVIAKVKSIPATSYTITALFQFVIPPPYNFVAAFYGGGFIQRDSVSPNKMALFGLHYRTSGLNTGGASQNTYLQGEYHNSDSSFNSGFDGTDVGAPHLGPLFWLGLTDDGTTRKYYYSPDGLNYYIVNKSPHATILTPNQIGFYLNNNCNTNVGTGVGLNILSYKESSGINI